MPLNDAACKCLKPKEKPYKKGNGFHGAEENERPQALHLPRPA
jgi:hypothetical protein